MLIGISRYSLLQRQPALPYLAGYLHVLIMRRGRLKPNFQFQTTFYRISNLVPSSVLQGKVRMGVASRL